MNTTQSKVQKQESRFEETLERLEACQGIVMDELEAYQKSIDEFVRQKVDEFVLSIVIPVYNEKNTIARVVSRVTALPLNSEIIIVDDSSTDGTREVLEKLEGLERVHVHFKEKNAGKGAAIRTGFELATGDYIVIQDADLEYDPSDIPNLLVPILKGEADVVYGSRFIGEEQQDESFIHRLGNAMLTGASNLVNGLNLTDMETCYKLFTREVVKSVNIEQDRFGLEPELTAKIARRGFHFVEVPISYNSRGYDEGKKIGVKDLFNAIYCIGRYGISD